MMLAQPAKFTYSAAAEIIQIDHGVNYQVNYTITHGSEVYDHRVQASRKKRRRYVGRAEGRSSATNSADWKGGMPEWWLAG